MTEPLPWEPIPIYRPYRVMIAGSATESFFAASETERGGPAIQRFREILETLEIEGLDRSTPQ